MPGGRYKLIKKLGSGSEGTTHLLESVATGKLIVRKRAHRFRWEGNIPREVLILRETLGHHRRIINLLEYRIEPDPINSRGEILAMHFDHYAGGDLTRYQVGRTEERFLWHVFYCIAEALAYMHHGFIQNAPPERTRCRNRWLPVVHRDLKPDNIFLKQRRTSDNPFPSVVLGDFGYATLEEFSDNGGCITYAPPEGEYSPMGDVWALGSTIHHMAHGRPPIDEMPRTWPGSKQEWLMSEEARNPRPLSRSYSCRLNRIMMDCLRLDPRQRVTSVELHQKLRRDRPGT